MDVSHSLLLLLSHLIGVQVMHVVVVELLLGIQQTSLVLLSQSLKRNLQSHSVVVVQVASPEFPHVDQRLLTRDVVFIIKQTSCSSPSHAASVHTWISTNLIKSGSLDLHLIHLVNQN